VSDDVPVTTSADAGLFIQEALCIGAVAPVTVVMAVHNHQAFVGEAIRSVLSQTYRDFLLLIVDDGSTDGSLEEIRKVVGDDARIRVISGTNRGLTQVLADAFAHIRSPYFGTVDSDDFLEPTALEQCVRILDLQPEVGMVYTGYAAMDAKGHVKGAGARMKVPYSAKALLANFMTFHFRLIRRSAYLETSGIDRTLQTAQDYDLCLKLSEVTRIAHIPQLLYRYRHHTDNVSVRSRVNQIECSKRAIENAL
jgi:glycosyltransferase involved in cell wall biosynthesis